MSLILLNIIIYLVILTCLFLIFFLFDLRYFRTLNELKGFYNIPFVTVSLVLIFLSLAGMPPMIGFLSKFLIIIFFFFKSNLIVTSIFLVINLFSIYFYILNLRFLVTKTSSVFFFF